MLDAGIAAGQDLPQGQTGPLDRLNLVRMALFLHDVNPVHLDRVYARERGLPDVIQQGPLNTAYLLGWLDGWLGERGKLVRMSLRYRANAHPEEVLTHTGRVLQRLDSDDARLWDCEVTQTSSRGVVTLSGRAVVRWPA